MPMTKKEVLEAALRGEGPLGRAGDDEPVFVLRGQDRFAPEIVDEWADRAEYAEGCPDEKVDAARDVADAMRSWPRRKYPD